MEQWMSEYIRPVLAGVSIAYIVGFTVWLLKVHGLMTTLVNQNKESIKLHQKAEKDIHKLDGRVDNHETRISIMESKPAQGFSAQ